MAADLQKMQKNQGVSERRIDKLEFVKHPRLFEKVSSSNTE